MIFFQDAFFKSVFCFAAFFDVCAMVFISSLPSCERKKKREIVPRPKENNRKDAHVVKKISPGKSSNMEAITFGSISSSFSRMANTAARMDMTKKFKTTNDFCVVQTLEFLC